MVSRDYRKEIGLKPGTPTVPWPLAIVILALIGVAAWFGVTKLHALPSHHGGEEIATSGAGGAPVAHVHK